MEGHYLDVGGVRTYCIDRGKGPAIVLLHGAALAVDAYSTWFRAIAALESEFRVVAFDQIGMGRTALPKDGVYKNRLERVDHALATIKALGVERACLAGHSEGGFMATRIAIVEPSLAAGLVIVTSGGTAPYLGEGRDAEWIKVAEATYNDRRQFDSFEGFLACNGRLSHRSDPVYEGILRENYQRSRDNGQMELVARMPKGLSNYLERERLQREYIFPHLKDLSVPTLLIWAFNDAGVVVERGVKLMELIQGAEMHIFSEASHNVMHDRADEFNRLLASWCRRCWASGDKTKAA
ncbi:MAG: alpha/beta hydrolase [Alphaproteobacteria bacterium]|nr:alpha/beta hydrolase [Alphaproteobacteria bacterium]